MELFHTLLLGSCVSALPKSVILAVCFRNRVSSLSFDPRMLVDGQLLLFLTLQSALQSSDRSFRYTQTLKPNIWLD